MDLSIFATAEAWISLVTLMFLEIVLGVDNIVFIAITTNRLPEEQQHIGRKLGLLGAMVMRILFLCLASWLVHMTEPLFEVNTGFYDHGFAIRDIVLMLGGLYLVYKCIAELREIMSLSDDEGSAELPDAPTKKTIGLPQAIGTIMVMDIVFSIDSVITAVGLAKYLIIMILAVMSAVLLMMLFIDQISEFINEHVEMKILAVFFIGVIGLLLFLDALGITTGVEMLDMHAEKLMVYFAMLFSFIIQMLQLAYKRRVKQRDERIREYVADQD